MRFEIVEMDGTARRIVLDGRMDAMGCEAIETGFTAAASAAGQHVLIDLSKVAYVGSLAVRLFISSVRVVTRRGLKMVIYGAQPQPLDVFETVALADLIPIVPDEAAALALLAG